MAQFKWYQWRIQISPRGRQLPKCVCSPIILQILCRTLHENERIWTRGEGGARPWCPLDPPMRTHVEILFVILNYYVQICIQDSKFSTIKINKSFYKVSVVLKRFIDIISAGILTTHYVLIIHFLL